MYNVSTMVCYHLTPPGPQHAQQCCTWVTVLEPSTQHQRLDMRQVGGAIYVQLPCRVSRSLWWLEDILSMHSSDTVRILQVLEWSCIFMISWVMVEKIAALRWSRPKTSILLLESWTLSRTFGTLREENPHFFAYQAGPWQDAGTVKAFRSLGLKLWSCCSWLDCTARKCSRKHFQRCLHMEQWRLPLGSALLWSGRGATARHCRVLAFGFRSSICQFWAWLWV